MESIREAEGTRRVIRIVGYTSIPSRGNVERASAASLYECHTPGGIPLNPDRDEENRLNGSDVMRFAIKAIPTVAATLNRASAILRMTLFPLALLTAVLPSIHDEASAQGPQAPVQGKNPQLLTDRPRANVKFGAVDWIFLIDTSASMSGLEPGAPNIFPRVQATLREFVSKIRDEDTLTIFVFDATSRLVLKVQLQSASDRNRVGPLIDNLVAKGAWTHTGAALTDALTEVYSREFKKRPAAIILLTDGHEDVRGIKNPTTIPDAVKLIRDEDVPYVFYVSLGTTPDPKLLGFKDRINEKAPGHGFVFDDYGGTNFAAEADKIRDTVDVRRFSPTINPQKLDLGRIRPGGQGGPYAIELSSKEPTTIWLTLLNVPPDHHIEGLPDTLEIGPEKVQRVTFKISLGDGATEGLQTYTLRIAPPHELDPNPRDVPINLLVHWTFIERIMHFLATAAAWLIHYLLFLVLILVVLGFLLYVWWQWYFYDRYPLEVIRSWFRTSPSSAVLNTPEGPIVLNQSMITLGNGGSKLKSSTAAIEIYREGADHIVKLLKGFVTFTDPARTSDFRLEPGDTRKLKHNDCIMMPGYHSPLRYFNSSRNR
jgi:Mg-chelatase subunit ChlD